MAKEKQPKVRKSKKASRSNAAAKVKTAKKSKAASKASVTSGRQRISRPPPKTAEQISAEKQALAMWTLLAAGGVAFGGKLKPRIEAAERVFLQYAGLVEVAKVKRAFWLTATSKGMDWAEQHLSDPLPDNVSGAAVLHAWLTRLHAFLQSHNIPLADLFMIQPENLLTAPTTGKSLDYPGLRERIRETYYDVAGGFDGRVLLRDLRPKLNDIDRTLVDAALMQMLRDEEASLMQLDYRPDVTDEDRTAAIQIGNEPRHIIWISE